ncbi:MAG: hypothetical protein AAF765_01805 [Bacteroidota bacterium]
MENWAEGVETVVTNDRYRSLDLNYFKDTWTFYKGWNRFRQKQTPTQINEYTPIVIDLIDIHNQRTTSAAHPNDNVSGYKLSQIQSALKDSRSPDTWRNKLNNTRPSGVTTAELNMLFVYMTSALNNPQTCKD